MSFTDISIKNGQEVKTRLLQASSARSAGDVVVISTGTTDGVNADASLATNTNVYKVAVALEDIASGEVGLYATEGTVRCTVPSGTYTAGNGLHVKTGAVADSGAAAEDSTGEAANNDFAIIHTGGTTVTEVIATLFNVPITGQL